MKKGRFQHIKRLLGLCFILLTGISAYCQSLHEHEFRTRSDKNKKPPIPEYVNQEIIPLQARTGGELTKAVFGYFPEWEYNKARDYIQYDLLSHICLFSFELKKDGSMTPPSYWPWTDVINKAHENGVKVVISIVNYDSEEFYDFLLDSHARKTFYNDLELLVRDNHLDGVNIDFEHLPIPNRNNMLNDFLLEMHDLLNLITPGAEVSFAGPAINAGGWDFVGLAASCDYIFIMGYDFKGGWSDNAGPSSPLTGGYYNLTRTLEKEYEDVVSTNPEKLILGVPYFGNKWITNSIDAKSGVVEHVRAYRYRDLIIEGLSSGMLWHDDSNTSWYIKIGGDNTIYQTWFDTRQSLALKYDLADSYDIKGVGIWALGYDRDHPELWNELRSRYLDTSSKTVESAKQKSEFNIYPNPFVSLSNISFNLIEGGSLTIRIYNQQGKLVAQVARGHFEPGKHSISKWGSDLPVGSYYCQFIHTVENTTHSHVKSFLKIKE
ncbi:MAG: T9SS type A sorting domain-containing protein [Bacteroidetes bacterium]|jgi:spore germination protein YaaH|nr:T9SS type A sorting domain-containing protein [Bacteroidota bacterium]MBT3749586.1 T9SS type A sorting domain-containing protein [Bacteroidota bacterium]MBT4400747.1 T9SS type A sorting domain-containing protein [Bacteroidota bacterium]MBT4411014.1 T9SS type A sorting domain-containing protein [Bacteroidota bacterium]MBT5426215.1 T9SS type A sorting domain-containing protein [Bacteroidota bacterium]